MFEVDVAKEDLPFIRNDCARPPRRLMNHLKESLRRFSDEELKGLEAIWLLDDVPEYANEEAAAAVAQGGRLYGLYHSRTEEVASYIALSIGDIYRGVRGHLPFYEFTPIPVLCMSRALAHEMAHHLIATRGYIFKPGEEVSDEESLANRYAQKHLEKMQRRWRYRFGFWLMKQLAELHYSSGAVYSSKQRYCEAADSWYMAWNLNPKLKNVSEWYHLAREKCVSGRESGSVGAG